MKITDQLHQKWKKGFYGPTL